jgi:hypothetical protein
VDSFWVHSETITFGWEILAVTRSEFYNAGLALQINQLLFLHLTFTIRYSNWYTLVVRELHGALYCSLWPLAL